MENINKSEAKLQEEVLADAKNDAKNVADFVKDEKDPGGTSKIAVDKETKKDDGKEKGDNIHETEEKNDTEKIEALKNLIHTFGGYDLNFKNMGNGSYKYEITKYTGDKMEWVDFKIPNEEELINKVNGFIDVGLYRKAQEINTSNSGYTYKDGVIYYDGDVTEYELEKFDMNLLKQSTDKAITAKETQEAPDETLQKSNDYQNSLKSEARTSLTGRIQLPDEVGVLGTMGDIDEQGIQAFDVTIYFGADKKVATTIYFDEKQQIGNIAQVDNDLAPYGYEIKKSGMGYEMKKTVK